MRQGIAALVAGAALAFVGVGGVAQADPSGDIDQSNTSTAGLDYISPNDFGQTFTPTVSGNLTQLDVNIAVASSSLVRVFVRAIEPSNQLSKYSVAIGGLQGVSSGWNSFPMSADAPLVAGQQYAFFFSTDLGFPVNSGQYSGGDLIYLPNFRTGGLAYGTSSPRDLLFKTYMEEPVSISGTPTSNVPVGHPYSYSYSVSGDASTTTAVVDGTLPAGLTLSSNGELSGTPTVARELNVYRASIQRLRYCLRSPQRSPFGTRNHQAHPRRRRARASSPRSSGWDPPVNPGDDPVNGYTVTASPGGATYSAAEDTRSMSISDLTPGTAYTFTVTASSAAGSGPASSTDQPHYPVHAAGCARSFHRTPRDTTADLTWTAPADGYSPIIPTS